MVRLFSALRLMRLVTRSWAMLAYLRLAYPAVRCHRGVRFGRGVRLRAFAGGTAEIGNGSHFGDFARVEVSQGRLVIGRNCLIGTGSVVICRAEIIIGDGTLLAEYVTIRDQDHRHSGDLPLSSQGFDATPIRIGNDVWLGAKATVTRGVEIAAHAVVGANAVVTRSIAERGTYVGIPARATR